MQFTPLGPWGVGASAGPATVGLKDDSGRVADPIGIPMGVGWEEGYTPFLASTFVYTCDSRPDRSSSDYSCIECVYIYMV